LKSDSCAKYSRDAHATITKQTAYPQGYPESNGYPEAKSGPLNGIKQIIDPIAHGKIGTTPRTASTQERRFRGGVEVRRKRKIVRDGEEGGGAVVWWMMMAGQTESCRERG
jgi:hypothetical protein